MKIEAFLELTHSLSSGNGRAMRIFMALFMNKEIVVGHLAKALNIPQPAVSSRLKSFKNQKIAKISSYVRHLTTYELDLDLANSYFINFTELSKLPEFQKDFAAYQKIAELD